MSGAMPAVYFFAESGTDVRLVEGLAARVSLRVLLRDVPGGRPVSQPTDVPVTISGAGRIRYAWRVFRTVLAERRCDAVLVQGYGLGAVAANAAALLRRRRCCMLVCSPAAEYYRAREGDGRPCSRAALAGLEALAYVNGVLGQRYVVLSRHLERLVRRHAAGSTPIHVVPVYGVDVHRFAPAVDRRTARMRRGLPLDAQIIFSSSRVAPEKDTRTLLEGFARLVAQGRDVYLLTRTGGYQDVLRLAAGKSVDHRVIATDAVDPRHDLVLDYRAADVCVQASRAEGLGFSVLEALACGTPVVASAVGGLVETIRDGETGWTVPPGDPEALARALGEALDRPCEARRRAAAGGEMVRQQFGAEEAFARLVEVLLGAGN